MEMQGNAAHGYQTRSKLTSDHYLKMGSVTLLYVSQLAELES